MRFDDFGWLDTADRQPTLNFSAGDGTPEIIVLHYTASYEAGSAIRTFKNGLSKASAHFVVGTDGDITQMVSIRDTAWHAGGGVYKGRDDVNSFAVGIEMVNPGYHFSDGTGGYLNWERRAVSRSLLKPFPVMVEAKDPWVGSATQFWPKFPEKQLASVQKLILTLLTTYPSLKDIVGHRDVDVVALQHAACYIRGIVVAAAQALERSFLVAKRSQKRKRKLRSVKVLQGQVGEGGFDFYGVHGGRLSPQPYRRGWVGQSWRWFPWGDVDCATAGWSLAALCMAHAAAPHDMAGCQSVSPTRHNKNIGPMNYYF